MNFYFYLSKKLLIYQLREIFIRLTNFFLIARLIFDSNIKENIYFKIFKNKDF